MYDAKTRNISVISGAHLFFRGVLIRVSCDVCDARARLPRLCVQIARVAA